MIEAILMLTGVIVLLLLIFVRTKYISTKRGWKIIKSGNSSKMYSELDENNNWRSITFECKMYSKDVPRHAITISSDWSNYPEWAQERKDEIRSRLKSVLKEPAYTVIEK
jgi:hypothetical protein